MIATICAILSKTMVDTRLGKAFPTVLRWTFGPECSFFLTVFHRFSWRLYAVNVNAREGIWLCSCRRHKKRTFHLVLSMPRSWRFLLSTQVVRNLPLLYQVYTSLSTSVAHIPGVGRHDVAGGCQSRHSGLTVLRSHRCNVCNSVVGRGVSRHLVG